MDTYGKELLELDSTVVRNLVSNNGVAELGNEIHIGLAILGGKSSVSWSAAFLGLDRVQSSHLERVCVERVDANEVRAEVGNDNILARRVKHSLVRVRRVLLRVGARRIGEFDILDILDIRRAGNVVC